ncbi:MAG: 2-oxo acid dehydrogenase subunit E2 [Acidimicrobiia bacterium]|nr:2-oxo acid dehydrogenase subunit E2 [Acidimicrobiia bacterium]
MSEYIIKLPDVGEGVAEAEIVEWHVNVGDAISEDDVLADVMTDKATVELPSPVNGIVRWLGADVGDVIAVGADLVKIDTDGDDGTAAAPDEQVEVSRDQTPDEPVEGSTEPAPAEPTPAEPVAASTEPSTDEPPRTSDAKPLAAPAVRARAQTLGVDLGTVRGSGPDGRIVHGDLDAIIAAAPTATPRATVPAPKATVGDESIDSVKITGLRRNIALRMQAATRRIPHFTYVEEIDVTELERLRAELNDARSDTQPKLSVLPFLMRAVVRAIADHPEMNARFDDEEGVVHRHRAVHLGIAVQTPRGLMVPVVAHAGDRDLWDSATEVARLSAAARSAKITLSELTGSTITITSLGALGGIVSTPVINAPEVAIIGVNKIVERPVYVGRELVPRQVMNLSSSFDHRIIDGADAAAFVQTIRRSLETPALLFV